MIFPLVGSPGTSTRLPIAAKPADPGSLLHRRGKLAGVSITATDVRNRTLSPHWKGGMRCHKAMEEVR